MKHYLFLIGRASDIRVDTITETGAFRLVSVAALSQQDAEAALSPLSRGERVFALGEATAVYMTHISAETSARWGGRRHNLQCGLFSAMRAEVNDALRRIADEERRPAAREFAQREYAELMTYWAPLFGFPKGWESSVFGDGC